MMAAIARRLTCTGLLIALAGPSSPTSQAAFSSRVYPRVGVAPVPLRVEVLIEAHADNRTLSIVVDSGEHLRASTVPLEGARAARFHSVIYRSMPAGHYQVEVELRDQTGKVRAEERHSVHLIP
jgi:hypothetical protein